MWLWKFLKSLFLYFTFSSDELERENLVCPQVFELSKSEDYKELDEYFTKLIELKEQNNVSREFNGQDIFFLESEPEKMVYTKLVLEEGLDKDLRVMRVHKELSAHQDSSTPYVTEFFKSRCVQLEKDLYYFMNDESRVYGSMAYGFQDDPRLKMDFSLTALRLDFYNRVLDKFRLFTYSDYKFDYLLKSQILYKVNQTGGPAAIRTYDPFFDLFYWITPLNEINGQGSGQRFDLLLIAKVLLELEFDFLYTYMPDISKEEIKKMKLNAGDKDPNKLEERLTGMYILPESIFGQAKFPDSCQRIPKKNRRIVQNLFIEFDRLTKMTNTLQDSEKEINAIRDLLGFLARSVSLLFQQGNQNQVFDRDQEGSMERNLINAIKNGVNKKNESTRKKNEIMNPSAVDSAHRSRKMINRDTRSSLALKSKNSKIITDPFLKVKRGSNQSRIGLRNLENKNFSQIKPNLELTTILNRNKSNNHQKTTFQNGTASESQEETPDLKRTDQNENEKIEREKNFKILENDTHRRFFEKIVSACKHDENILKTPFLEPLIEENLDLVQELERQHLENVKKVDTLLL